MGAGEGLSGGLDGLIGREADAVVERLTREHPRALADNPDGVALLGKAVRDAIRLGLDAGIPSDWRRTGGDLPELLAAGYREIHVRATAAGEAQTLCSR